MLFVLRFERESKKKSLSEWEREKEKGGWEGGEKKRNLICESSFRGSSLETKSSATKNHMLVVVYKWTPTAYSSFCMSTGKTGYQFLKSITVSIIIISVFLFGDDECGMLQ